MDMCVALKESRMNAEEAKYRIINRLDLEENITLENFFFLYIDINRSGIKELGSRV